MLQINLLTATVGSIREAVQVGGAVDSIHELLQIRAASIPDRVAFSFLGDDPEGVRHITYGGLHQQACAIADVLQQTAGPGERALLLYPPGLDFIAAFFGCLYAGVVPAPAYPPRLDRLNQDGQTLRAIANDCQPVVVLTTSVLAPFLTGTSSQLASLRWLVTDHLDLGHACRHRSPSLKGDVGAVLQYTSGSTASPKGVLLSHRNLMYALQMLQIAFGKPRQHIVDTGVGVNWLPLYHDLGLIGGVLYPLFEGKPCVLLSPLRFLRQPFRWLEAISKYRAGVSAGPCFAYQWCLDRIPPEQRAGLDLSSWRIAGIGAEPIQAHTLRNFVNAFAPYGFRPESFCPGYGLAEATLFVTGGWHGGFPRIRSVNASVLDGGPVTDPTRATPTRECVSCGRPWLGTRVEIVHPETRRLCPERTVGEIWVAGPSVAQGYWGRPEETQRTFRAYLQDTGEGPFLRTGDLGFLEKGELFVTGRFKDLIVLRGRNHYPEDLELTVQSVHPSLRAGAGAAFESYQQGQPQLIIVQEIQRRCRNVDVMRLIGEIRKEVGDRHGVHVHEVQLLQYGSLPKTSSGKIQRHACRQGYEQGSLHRWKEGRV